MGTAHSKQHKRIDIWTGSAMSTDLFMADKQLYLFLPNIGAYVFQMSIVPPQQASVFADR